SKVLCRCTNCKAGWPTEGSFPPPPDNGVSHTTTSEESDRRLPVFRSVRLTCPVTVICPSAAGTPMESAMHDNAAHWSQNRCRLQRLRIRRGFLSSDRRDSQNTVQRRS